MLVREREVLVSAVSIVTIDKQTKPPACMALSASRQVSRLRRFLQVSRSVDGPGTLRIILGMGASVEALVLGAIDAMDALAARHDRAAMR